MSRVGFVLLAALALAAPSLALPGLPAAEAEPPFRFVANPAAGEYLVHRNTDVEAKLKAVAEEHADLATVESIGKSVLGQDLWSITLTAPDSTARYRVYVDGGHHGNEYMGVELAMAYLGHLVEGYAAGDENVTSFLAETSVMIVPMVNPDGNLLDTRKNARQVDLNRNYPFMWGGEGSGASPSDLNYHGPEPLSEPETQANWAAATAFNPHIWVTGHTGIAEFYWPWGWTHDPSPDDAMFTSLEAPFENATNGRVDAMQGAELYIVTGANDDSAYGLLGIPGFTFEVHEDQFQPAYTGGIPPAIAEQLAGLVWITEHTKHLGANVAAQPIPEGDDLVVRLVNSGWGEARNVTVNLTLGDAVLASRVVSVPAGADATVRFDAVPAGAGISGAYPRLLVNTTPVWDLDVAGFLSGEPGGVALPVPGASPLAALAAVAAVAVLLTRRR